MKNDLVELIIAVLIVIAVIFGIISMKSCVGKDDYSNYNNGICIKCGGEYKFSNATSTYGWGKEYYYTCEDCDYTIVTQRMME